MDQLIQEYSTAHPKFQEKNLLKTRIELSREVLNRDFPEERRSWLLHRLSHAHTPEEVIELIPQVMS